MGLKDLLAKWRQDGEKITKHTNFKKLMILAMLFGIGLKVGFDLLYNKFI